MYPWLFLVREVNVRVLGKGLELGKDWKRVGVRMVEGLR